MMHSVAAFSDAFRAAGDSEAKQTRRDHSTAHVPALTSHHKRVPFFKSDRTHSSRQVARY